MARLSSGSVEGRASGGKRLGRAFAVLGLVTAATIALEALALAYSTARERQAIAAVANRLPRTRVPDGSFSMEKTEWASLPLVAGISEFRVRSGEDGPSLLVTGTGGSGELDLSTGKTIQEFAFQVERPLRSPSTFLDGAVTAEPRILNGEPGWGESSLFLTFHGEVIGWYPGAPLCAPVQVPSGKGGFVVLVAQQGEQGVALLNGKDGIEWTADWGGESTKFQMRSFDVGGDGTTEWLFADGEALRVYGDGGALLRTVQPPKAGYVNSVSLPARSEVLDHAAVLLGAYVDGAQVFFGYDEKLEPLGGAHSQEEIDPFVRSLRVERETGSLFVKGQERITQALVAGISGTSFEVLVFDDTGALLWKTDFDVSGEDLQFGHGAIAVLREDPLRVAAGFGADVWMLEEQP